MSDRKTKTGFDLKITGFLEFHVNDLFATGQCDPNFMVNEVKEVLAKHGVTNVEFTAKHRNRKTIDATDDAAAD